MTPMWKSVRRTFPPCAGLASRGALRSTRLLGARYRVEIGFRAVMGQGLECGEEHFVRKKLRGSEFRAYVDAGALAGAATLVWRNGRVVRTAIVGCRDLVTNLPVERGTIFRIASMTKPLTTVAALMLYDEARFALDEPITRHAPELARLRVLRHPDGPLDQTDAAERPITFGDLLTHRSGLTYGEFHRGPISRACAEALGGQIDNSLGPDEWIARLGTLPLIDQPGVGFHYGLSTDLLGFLIARL